MNAVLWISNDNLFLSYRTTHIDKLKHEQGSHHFAGYISKAFS